MTITILRGNALALPLADNTVDLVITSPPYFGLRSYQDDGAHYAGQLGSEATPAEFVAALLEVTRECMRVLKPSGSIWVNLGDKYAGSRMDGSSDNGTGATSLAGTASIRERSAASGQGGKASTSVRTKSLIGIPWRYALACIDDLGLILRAEVIWSKPNGLPESVTDRVRRSHEQWFHFTLNPRYFSAVDEIREAHADVSIKRAMPHRANPGRRGVEVYGDTASAQTLDLANMTHPLGKLPGSVWTVPTQPLTVPAHLGVDHFAAFPMEWPRRVIRGWSPAGVCSACGEGRRPVVDPTEAYAQTLGTAAVNHVQDATHGKHRWRSGTFSGYLVGYVCACPDTIAPTTPSVILDPFGGTGTVALVAHALGRHGISVDMSADYNRLARWRSTDPGQIASAMQVDKPAPVINGQGELFEVDA